MSNESLDTSSLQRWAIGDLVDNWNRGIFAEWPVGQALKCIGAESVRLQPDLEP